MSVVNEPPGHAAQVRPGRIGPTGAGHDDHGVVDLISEVHQGVHGLPVRTDLGQLRRRAVEGRRPGSEGGPDRWTAEPDIQRYDMALMESYGFDLAMSPA